MKQRFPLFAQRLSGKKKYLKWDATDVWRNRRWSSDASLVAGKNTGLLIIIERTWYSVMYVKKKLVTITVYISGKRSTKMTSPISCARHRRANYLLRSGVVFVAKVLQHWQVLKVRLTLKKHNEMPSIKKQFVARYCSTLSSWKLCVSGWQCPRSLIKTF